MPGIGKVSVQRPNPICLKEITEYSCGYCVWSVEDKQQYVGEAKNTWLYGKPWHQILAESVKVPAESYAAIKASFIKMCKESNSCSKDITHWRVKLDAIDSIGNGLGAGNGK